MYYGTCPKTNLDHKNRIATDNRITNLREATRSQQGYNTKTRMRKNKLPRGVYKQTKGSKYFSSIKVNKNSIYLGTFSKINDAAKAYNKASIKFHKEFSYLRAS